MAIFFESFGSPRGFTAQQVEQAVHNVNTIGDVHILQCGYSLPFRTLWCFIEAETEPEAENAFLGSGFNHLFRLGRSQQLDGLVAGTVPHALPVSRA